MCLLQHAFRVSCSLQYRNNFHTLIISLNYSKVSKDIRRINSTVYSLFDVCVILSNLLNSYKIAYSAYTVFHTVMGQTAIVFVVAFIAFKFLSSDSCSFLFSSILPLSPSVS